MQRSGIEYDKCFVVNLDRHNSRLKRMQRFKPLFNFERFPAVDGFSIDKAKLPLQLKSKKMYPGRIGCFLSHYNLWKRIIDEKVSLSLILEDDIIYTPETGVLNEVNRFKDYDILYLGCHTLKAFAIPVPVQPFQHIFSFDFPLGTWAYLLTLKGATILVENLDEIREPVDMQMNSVVLNRKVVKPICFHPITGKNWSSTSRQLASH